MSENYYSDYPVMIDEKEIQNHIGIDISAKLKGQSTTKIQNFLDTVHSAVYDYLIYPTGPRELKDAIIENFRVELEKPLKRALLSQARYLISNQTNIALWNGMVKTVSGVEAKDIQDIMTKIVSPDVYNILFAATPNLLYAGG